MGISTVMAVIRNECWLSGARVKIPGALPNHNIKPACEMGPPLRHLPRPTDPLPEITISGIGCAPKLDRSTEPPVRTKEAKFGGDTSIVARRCSRAEPLGYQVSIDQAATLPQTIDPPLIYLNYPRRIEPFFKSLRLLPGRPSSRDQNHVSLSR
ncbi:hypothetical protein RRG08_029272 [Elysia crispata]|uniref:Uncharacterized protein n=1 Tax=Elysia crispata TaxID=231223 RepID=A0AAE1AJ49_9GAST|nr:hypothetical protein RRG08_029272 [Elysia crispata]